MEILNTNLVFTQTLTQRPTTTAIVLHHAEARNASVEDIHQWHLNNGWAGIGYHFYVRKDGKVYQGRPIDKLGSHSKGSNSFSIGICAEGNYDSLDKTMPMVQKLAIEQLIRYIFGNYGKLKIYGHCEVYATACPGKYYPLSYFKTVTTVLPKPVAKVVAKVAIAINKITKKGFTINTKITLKKGDKGKDVGILESALYTLGIYTGKNDNDFGPILETSVKVFQHKYGLTEDGKAGPETLNKLNNLLK